MSRLTLALVCIFTVSRIFEGTVLPHGARRDENKILKEKIHDKIAYIAALTDEEHLKFIDGLKSTSKPHDLSEAAIERLVVQHMINVTRAILPDLQKLISMTDNLEQSAAGVNVHFAGDHVQTILQAVYGEENHPEFYKSLGKRIAAYAQTQIRLIFQHKNQKI